MYYITEKQKYFNILKSLKKRNDFFLLWLKSEEIEEFIKSFDGKIYNKRFVDNAFKFFADFIERMGLNDEFTALDAYMQKPSYIPKDTKSSSPLCFSFKKTQDRYSNFSLDFYVTLLVEGGNKLRIDYETLKQNIVDAIKRYEDDNADILDTIENYDKYQDKIKQLQNLCEECNKLPSSFRRNLSKDYFYF